MNSERQNIMKLLTLGKPYWKGQIIASVIFVLSATINLLSPPYFGKFIDSLTSGVIRVNLVLLIISLNVATIITGVLLNYLLAYYTDRCAMDLREKIFSHLLKQHSLSLDKKSTGVAMSVVNMDAPVAAEKAFTFLPVMFGNVYSFLFASCILYILSPHLLVISFAFIPLYYLSWKKEYSSMLRSGREEREVIGSINERVREGLENVMIIKLYNAKNFFLDGFRNAQRSWFESIIHLHYRKQILTAMIAALTWISPYIILGAGAFLVVGGILTLGKLIAFFTSVNLLFSSLSTTFRQMSSLPLAVAAHERISKTLYTKVEEEREGLPFLQNADIIIKDLKFSYADEQVFEGINLTIEKGKKIAIVGATGSGKSTLAKIIASYYDEYEGQVLLGKRELREYSTSDLRERIAYVDGNSPLFNLSVRENITLGKEYGEEDLKMAIETAEIDFVEDLETSVGESGNLLSLGQKQRIALARALIRKPEILILDEATSGVDSEKESNIYRKLKNLKSTIIIISHRLSTITYADRIYLIKDGKIIDSGVHDDLLRRNNYYKKLVAEQLIN